ncbi:MAG: hypothetical protein HC871_05930 [Rhizobiales bacterium]|nr:hypothetical protein [Hyphomicrobiales bacterium]
MRAAAISSPGPSIKSTQPATSETAPITWRGSAKPSEAASAARKALCEKNEASPFTATSFDRSSTSSSAAAIGPSDVLAPLIERLGRLSGDAPDLNQLLYLEQQFFLADHNLNYTDKASMAESIEVRVPYLDRELMTFAATLPVDLKLKGATTKYLLRKIAEPLLPHDVIYRPKVGFGAPIQEWLETDLKEMVEDVLSPESLKSRGWFDPQAVAALRAANKSGRIDATMTIFELICLELWARSFVDDTSLAAAA